MVEISIQNPPGVASSNIFGLKSILLRNIYLLIIGFSWILLPSSSGQNVNVYYKKFVVPGNAEYNRWMSSPEMKRRMREREEQMASNVSEYYNLYTNGSRSFFEFDTTISLKEIPEERFGWWSREDAKLSYAKNILTGNVTIRSEILADSICRSENFRDKYQWKLGKGKKIFAGLECKKAYFVNDEGDTTTAWFAPELPITDGPEDFGGAPGMILAIEATSFNYIAEKVAVGEFKIPLNTRPEEDCLEEKEFREKVREAMMKKFIQE